jgi:hypothetical protein
MAFVRKNYEITEWVDCDLKHTQTGIIRVSSTHTDKHHPSIIHTHRQASSEYHPHTQTGIIRVSPTHTDKHHLSITHKHRLVFLEIEGSAEFVYYTFSHLQRRSPLASFLKPLEQRIVNQTWRWQGAYRQIEMWRVVRVGRVHVHWCYITLSAR